MRFSLRKLFSIVDGRLSTKMDDVYEILNHVTGESLFTHHLPAAMKFIEKASPEWFGMVASEIEDVRLLVGDKFEDMIDFIQTEHNPSFDIPPLTAEEKKGFGDFMVNNSLLLNRS